MDKNTSELLFREHLDSRSHHIVMTVTLVLGIVATLTNAGMVRTLVIIGSQSVTAILMWMVAVCNLIAGVFMMVISIASLVSNHNAWYMIGSAIIFNGSTTGTIIGLLGLLIERYAALKQFPKSIPLASKWQKIIMIVFLTLVAGLYGIPTGTAAMGFTLSLIQIEQSRFVLTCLLDILIWSTFVVCFILHGIETRKKIFDPMVQNSANLKGELRSAKAILQSSLTTVLLCSAIVLAKLGAVMDNPKGFSTALWFGTLEYILRISHSGVLPIVLCFNSKRFRNAMLSACIKENKYIHISVEGDSSLQTSRPEQAAILPRSATVSRRNATQPMKMPPYLEASACQQPIQHAGNSFKQAGTGNNMTKKVSLSVATDKPQRTRTASLAMNSEGMNMGTNPNQNDASNKNETYAKFAPGIVDVTSENDVFVDTLGNVKIQTMFNICKKVSNSANGQINLNEGVESTPEIKKNVGTLEEKERKTKSCQVDKISSPLKSGFESNRNKNSNKKLSVVNPNNVEYLNGLLSPRYLRPRAFSLPHSTASPDLSAFRKSFFTSNIIPENHEQQDTEQDETCQPLSPCIRSRRAYSIDSGTLPGAIYTPPMRMRSGSSSNFEFHIPKRSSSSFSSCTNPTDSHASLKTHLGSRMVGCHKATCKVQIFSPSDSIEKKNDTSLGKVETTISIIGKSQVQFDPPPEKDLEVMDQYSGVFLGTYGCPF